MITEIPDHVVDPVCWIYYDGECQLCTTSADRWRSALNQRRFQMLPLQSEEAMRRLGTAGPGTWKEMQLQLADGTLLGGADAILEIARRIWWAWPLWLLGKLPGAMVLFRWGYRILAANRHCFNDACVITHRWPELDWLPLLILPLGVASCINVLPHWVFMWAFAYAIFMGCKWLTLRREFAHRPRPSRLTTLAYLILWPGMDANNFFRVGQTIRSSLVQWISAVTKTLVGVSMLGFATAGIIDFHPLLAGWIGMVGVVMLLHFGTFHLLALSWQRTGRNVHPLMKSPLLANSLSDFWGNRWNTAFNSLAHDFVFRPIVHKFGVRGATLCVFLISGLIHDLVISLPARGGYGLPTAYFLLQGLAVIFERSPLGRSLCLGTGWRGRGFAWLVTAVPAFWLFHPQFINHVILPMLQTIGSNWTFK